MRDGLTDHGAQAAMVGMRGRQSQRAGSEGRGMPDPASLRLNPSESALVKKAFAAAAASE
jgi:hypothetical protein